MKTRRKRKDTHVVMGPNPHLSTCLGCGATLDVKLPQSVNVLIATMKAFIRTHTPHTPKGTVS